jgi:hypothetical protein
VAFNSETSLRRLTVLQHQEAAGKFNGLIFRGKGLMSEGSKKDMYSRRRFLGASSAALAAVGMLPAAEAAGQKQKPYPSKEDRSASAPGSEIQRWTPSIPILFCRHPPTLGREPENHLSD